MSNILKVTSPIGGYENGNNIKMNPTANAEVQGVQAPITPLSVYPSQTHLLRLKPLLQPVFTVPHEHRSNPEPAHRTPHSPRKTTPL